MDPFARFKDDQKVAWSTFASMELFTGRVAPSLVRHARVTAGAELLDVACGTGVVTLTAARAGARATGVDLTPELVRHAKDHAALMGAEASFREGDVEALPFGDASFDVVVSQFGHIFAPRPEVAIREMLRVLRPGGTIAFSTWPPEHMVGRTFALMASYAPPPPDAAPPVRWGEPSVVRERLGAAVKDLSFSRDTMWIPALSPAHFRASFERNFGPMNRLLATLDASAPEKAAELRRGYEAVTSDYFEDNAVRHDFLLTRATKA